MVSTDQKPWIAVAEDVLNGVYDDRKRDRCLMKSIKIGLRGIKDPTCEEAYEKVKEFLKVQK